ncbi:MAG: GNAT family N-acetyltransferase [Malacoplasma sp.]
MIYRLKDIKVKYKELVGLSKLIINISNKTSNIEFENDLAKYFLNNSIKRANVLYILENNNELIGALFAYIPNYCAANETINNYTYATNLNTSILKKLKYKNLSAEELKILQHELLMEKEYTKNVWSHTIKRNDSAEILFFSIAENHQKKGHSKPLLNAFLDDVRINNIKKYHLFTTSTCDFEYYEKLGMKRIKATSLPQNITLLVYEKQI